MHAHVPRDQNDFLLHWVIFLFESLVLRPAQQARRCEVRAHNTCGTTFESAERFLTAPRRSQMESASPVYATMHSSNLSVARELATVKLTFKRLRAFQLGRSLSTLTASDVPFSTCRHALPQCHPLSHHSSWLFAQEVKIIQHAASRYEFVHS